MVNKLTYEVSDEWRVMSDKQRGALAAMQGVGFQGPSGFVGLCRTLEIKKYENSDE